MLSKYPSIVIVYRTSERSKKCLIKVYENTHIDQILETIKRKPLIPREWILEAISVGGDDNKIKEYKKKYSVK